jgi:hypothetical protein
MGRLKRRILRKLKDVKGDRKGGRKRKKKR